MEIIILRTNLKEALSAVERSVTENNNLPILKNVLLNAESKLSVQATNLEVGSTYSAAAKIISQGSITVPFSALYTIVTNSNSDRVTLSSKESVLDVKTDNYEAKIQGVKADEFPIIPRIENSESYIEISADVFQEAINQVGNATQTSNLKPELHSILLDYQTGMIKLVATDGFRLAEKTLLSDSFKTNFKKGMKAIVPLKTMQEVVRVFPTEEKIKISIDPHQIAFDSKTMHFISRLIDAQYPDYAQIIPQKTELSFQCSRKELETAVKLVSSFTGKGGDVHLSFEKKALKVHAQSQHIGENTYMVSTKKQTGEQMPETVFNARYLLDGLKSISSEYITVEANDQTKPVVLKPVNKNSFFYIVMPIHQG